MPVRTMSSRRPDGQHALRLRSASRLALVALALGLSACGSCGDERGGLPAPARSDADGGRARLFRRDELGADGGVSPAFRRRLFQLDAGVSDAAIE